MFAVALGTASAAGDGATLGQVVPGNAPCGAPESIIVAQTATSGGVSYEVPSGKWRVIWWAAAGSPTGHIALVIFRPTGNPNEFRIVGSAAPRSLPKPKQQVPRNDQRQGRRPAALGRAEHDLRRQHGGSRRYGQHLLPRGYAAHRRDDGDSASRLRDRLPNQHEGKPHPPLVVAAPSANGRSLRTFPAGDPLWAGRRCRRLVEHRVRSASRLKPLLRVVRGSLRARRKACGGGGRRRHRLGVLFRPVFARAIELALALLFLRNLDGAACHAAQWPETSAHSDSAET